MVTVHCLQILSTWREIIMVISLCCSIFFHTLPEYLLLPNIHSLRQILLLLLIINANARPAADFMKLNAGAKCSPFRLRSVGFRSLRHFRSLSLSPAPSTTVDSQLDEKGGH